MREKVYIEELKKEIQQKQDRIDSLVGQINEMKSSRSWRVTAPCRVIGTIVRGLSYLDKDLLRKGIRSLGNEGLSKTVAKIDQHINNVSQVKSEAFPCFDGLIEISNLPTYIESNGGKFYGKEFLSETSCSYALLISHEASLTGAPMALRYLGLCLQKKYITPIFLSPSEGKIVNELSRDGIPTIVFPELLPFIQPWLAGGALPNEPKLINNIRNLFDFIVANTLITAPVVSQLIDTDTPVLWWIHEAEESYSEHFQRTLPKKLSTNIRVFTGGDYARRVLAKYRPQYNSENLLYPVPYSESQHAKTTLIEKKGKLLFLCVGTLQTRKAQDKLVDAIIQLPSNIRERTLFLFIGRNCSPEIFEKIKSATATYPENVLYMDEISQQDLSNFYSIMDVLVCPSLDDPMPIVVTDALARSKLVLCSDNVGTAELLKSSNSGIVYPAHDVGALVAKIQSIVTAPYLYSSVSARARNVYEEYFSPEVFDKNLDKTLNSIKKKKLKSKVSVIIPTFNAGVAFEKLLCSLNEQSGLDDLEIIVVDSGSKDKTVDVCKRNGVKLIEITQEEFSHSYARNLGAKYASGDILLFMTQDALPSSKEWVRRMISPLINENIVACSCLEQCPPGTDLFYRCNSNIHNKFMSSAGEVCSLELVKDTYTLRKYSSLNDTNCAIKASVFRLFQYRNSYAEDLDLGIRLIKKGYQLKFIKDNPIIHGHNRNCDYYLRRSYIETQTLDKMLNRSDCAIEISRLFGSCSAYVIIKTAIENIKKELEFPIRSELIMKRLCEELCENREIDIKIAFDRFAELGSESLLFSNLKQIYDLREIISDKYIADDVFAEITYYLNHDLSIFVCENYDTVDLKLFEEIADCLIKQFAVLLGIYLARPLEVEFASGGLEKMLNMEFGSV